MPTFSTIPHSTIISTCLPFNNSKPLKKSSVVGAQSGANSLHSILIILFYEYYPKYHKHDVKRALREWDRKFADADTDAEVDADVDADADAEAAADEPHSDIGADDDDDDVEGDDNDDVPDQADVDRRDDVVFSAIQGR